MHTSIATSQQSPAQPAAPPLPLFLSLPVLLTTLQTYETTAGCSKPNRSPTAKRFNPLDEVQRQPHVEPRRRSEGGGRQRAGPANCDELEEEIPEHARWPCQHAINTLCSPPEQPMIVLANTISCPTRSKLASCDVKCEVITNPEAMVIKRVNASVPLVNRKT